jgi:hypothetical protein
MATVDPTGGGAFVVFALTLKERQFLRRTFSHCKAGREGDLKTHPNDPNAGRWRADAAAYERLMTGIQAGLIFPDDRVRRLVSELATAPERKEEYERVVFEHGALLALSEQIGAGR